MTISELNGQICECCKKNIARNESHFGMFLCKSCTTGIDHAADDRRCETKSNRMSGLNDDGSLTKKRSPIGEIEYGRWDS